MSGRWHNWGRQNQGWSLEIGNAFRCSVVRNYPDGKIVPESWNASVNQTHLGSYADVDVAKMRVEESVAWDMKQVLEDWQVFLRETARSKRD